MSKNVTKKLPKHEKTQYLLGFLQMERVSGIDEKRSKPQKHAKTPIKTRENTPIRIEKNIFCYQMCYQRKTASCSLN